SWQISNVDMDGTISQLATRSKIPLDPSARRRRRLIMALNRKVDFLTRNVVKAVIIRTASSSWESIETGGDPSHALPLVPSLTSWLAKIPEDALQELDCEIGNPSVGAVTAPGLVRRVQGCLSRCIAKAWLTPMV